MKEELRQKLLAKFPEWHKQPLRLSIAEMEEPYNVLDYFFECYSLPDIRICLKELLDDSLRAENVEAGSHVSTHDDIQKLVEAAWIIHQQTGNETQNGQNHFELNYYALKVHRFVLRMKFLFEYHRIITFIRIITMML